MPLSGGTMELGSCITRIIHQDDTLTNIIITPTCLIACEEYEPNESDDDDEYLVALNMETSGSREWFLYFFFVCVITRVTSWAHFSSTYLHS